MTAPSGRAPARERNGHGSPPAGRDESAAPSRAALWVPVLIYMALIFGLSARAVLPKASRLLPDKVAHAGVYGGLAGLLVRARSKGWRRPVTFGVCAVSVLIAVLYGVTDEIHQSFVPSRSMEAADLLADAVGAVGAASVLYAWGIIRGRHAL